MLGWADGTPAVEVRVEDMGLVLVLVQVHCGSCGDNYEQVDLSNCSTLGLVVHFSSLLASSVFSLKLQLDLSCGSPARFGTPEAFSPLLDKDLLSRESWAESVPNGIHPNATSRVSKMALTYTD